MNRILKLSKGATLLEIMLVLAIASMIVLMSVRYYKSATTSQQAAALSSQTLQVIAAAEALGQGGTGYAAVTTAAMQGAMGSTAALQYTWGSFSFSGAASSFVVTMSGTIPTGVCELVKATLSSNPRVVGMASTCGTFTYDGTK